MEHLTTPPRRCIGCDVGKDFIAVFDSHTGHTTRLPNQWDALTAFAAALAPESLVICEATGGYEAALLAALVQADRAAHRADARKVKAFIRSFGTLGKTDASDARALARYGQERQDQLPLWTAREPVREQLRTLVTTRRELVAQRVACAHRLRAPGAGPVAPFLRRLLAALEAEIAALETATQDLIRTCTPLQQAVGVLQGMAGIGPTTAVTLLALMPELGTLQRRQAASLAGLAPHPKQSGARDGYRRTRGGRPDIRRTLFMAALAAARHNPSLKAFYQRLRNNGKKPLVALTALMRKIITIANAKLHDVSQVHLS